MDTLSEDHSRHGGTHGGSSGGASSGVAAAAWTRAGSFANISSSTFNGSSNVNGSSTGSGSSAWTAQQTRLWNADAAHLSSWDGASNVGSSILPSVTSAAVSANVSPNRPHHPPWLAADGGRGNSSSGMSDSTHNFHIRQPSFGGHAAGGLEHHNDGSSSPTAGGGSPMSTAGGGMSAFAIFAASRSAMLATGSHSPNSHFSLHQHQLQQHQLHHQLQLQQLQSAGAEGYYATPASPLRGGSKGGVDATGRLNSAAVAHLGGAGGSSGGGGGGRHRSMPSYGSSCQSFDDLLAGSSVGTEAGGAGPGVDVITMEEDEEVGLLWGQRVWVGSGRP